MTLSSLRARVVAVSAVFVFFLARASHAQPIDVVTFAKAAPWGLIDAHLQFGMDLGFFKEERIQPEFVVVGGSYAALQQIVAGRAQLGFIAPEALPASLQPGATPIPLRLVYNYLRTPFFEVVVLAKSSIRTLADLKGKTIGVMALGSGNVPVTKAGIAANGVPATGYTLLPVGAGAQAVQALTSGSIDALNLWATLHAQVEENGIAIRRLQFPAEFDGIPATSVGASDETIRNKPDLIARFGRAATKSSVACIANPEACVRSFWKAFPTQKPGGSDTEAMASTLRILQVSLARLATFRGADKRFGAFDPVDWRSTIAALQVGGLIQATDLPLDRIYTNAFVDEYNRFDRALVEKRAREAR